MHKLSKFVPEIMTLVSWANIMGNDKLFILKAVLFM
jgi:hypothetical protein